jgi:hypothetical protein
MAWTNPKTDFSPGNVLTAAQMNAIGGDLDALTAARRLGFQSRATDYTANQSALASAADIFGSDITFTAAGSVSYIVEFYCARVATGGASAGSATEVHLVDGTGADLGVMGNVVTPAAASTSVMMCSRIRYTPAAGSRTINARAIFVTAGNGVLYAASYGTGTPFPMTLAVYGPDVTS